MILGVLLGLVTAFCIWQRDTIYFLMHANRIQVKDAREIRAVLLSGDYGAVRETGGGLVYSLLDDSIELTVTFAGGALSCMDASFNLYTVPIKTVSDALRQAHFVLSPYLTPPEINALCVIIAGEMPGYTTAETMDYRRAVGDYLLSVSGSLVTGDASVRVEQISREEWLR